MRLVNATKSVGKALFPCLHDNLLGDIMPNISTSSALGLNHSFLQHPANCMSRINKSFYQLKLPNYVQRFVNFSQPSFYLPLVAFPPQNSKEIQITSTSDPLVSSRLKEVQFQAKRTKPAQTTKDSSQRTYPPELFITLQTYPSRLGLSMCSGTWSFTRASVER